jgi:CheY-like chemotaxis protein
VGFSAIMADIEDRDERLKFLNIIESNNKRLLMLIDEVLDLSKIESGILSFNFSSVRMNDLCLDIFRTYQYYTGKATLILDLPGEDLYIRTDRNRLTQVISNLIDNALKFTPQGTITIGYRTLPEWVELFVSDTGIGIPEDKLEKVFERFVKVNNFAKGTGLGLPICKTIVERLGGEITVTSRLGSGSKFTFKIPKQLVGMDDDHFRIQPVSPSPVRNKREGKATILVVEDIDDNFELIQTMIGPGYYLIHARDGKQAVSLFESEQPDLILMDIKLPEVNGLEAIETIREKSPFYPPIIAVSAYAYDRNKKMLLENGCKDFLIKPLDKELLLATIKKYL